MEESLYTKPHYMFFLMVPTGISQGFFTIVLPYVLIQHGFAVATTAGIVAVGASASLFRFLFGPFVDLSLSLKKWYWISMIALTSTLLLLSNINYSVKDHFSLTMMVFTSQIAANFLMMPVTAFIAKCIPESRKGAASGWFQAGMLAGIGLGGGAGLWLATHYSVSASGLILCGNCFLFGLVVLLIKDVHYDKIKNITTELRYMGKDMLALIRVPLALFTIILICMPIGSGAASNLWSAIALDWKTDADTVALITGIISGVVSTLGCVLGGYVVDKWGVWVGYLFSGGLCAVVTLVMALMPMDPVVFIAGVLAYTFGIGLINAAFTAVIIFAIGKKNVVTKYALLASFGNLPVVYMTAFDGWAHDKYNSKWMLLAEAAAGFMFIIISVFAIQYMSRRKLLMPAA